MSQMNIDPNILQSYLRAAEAVQNSALTSGALPNSGANTGNFFSSLGGGQGGYAPSYGAAPQNVNPQTGFWQPSVQYNPQGAANQGQPTQTPQNPNPVQGQGSSLSGGFTPATPNGAGQDLDWWTRMKNSAVGNTTDNPNLGQGMSEAERDQRFWLGAGSILGALGGAVGGADSWQGRLGNVASGLNQAQVGAMDARNKDARDNEYANGYMQAALKGGAGALAGMKGSDGQQASTPPAPMKTPSGQNNTNLTSAAAASNGALPRTPSALSGDTTKWPGATALAGLEDLLGGTSLRNLYDTSNLA